MLIQAQNAHPHPSLSVPHIAQLQEENLHVRHIPKHQFLKIIMCRGCGLQFQIQIVRIIDGKTTQDKKKHMIDR
jgi:hypothetical protein